MQTNPQHGATSSRWRLEQEIARGGMGIVEHIFDRRLLRHVARKRVRPDMAHLSNQLLLEARVLGRLRHPNIVTLHDMGWDVDGLPFFTMELLEGQTLHQHLHHASPQTTLDGLMTLLSPLFDVLTFAHERGVLHRDIKPENIMLGLHGDLCVMDWGLAMIFDPEAFGIDPLAGHEVHALLDKTCAGTPEFMSPEQIQLQDQLDPRVDVYAVGVLLYFILTGTYPFQGETSASTFELALRATPPPMRTRHIEVTPALENVVLRALAKQRENRFDSIHALRGALQELTARASPTTRRLFPGESLVVQGDLATEAFLVVEGSCDVFAEIEGTTIQVGHLTPGDFVGESAFLTRGVRNATVVAQEATVVHVIQATHLNTLQRDLPAWASAMLTSLTHRGRVSERRFRRLLRGPNHTDLIRQLLMWLTTFGIQGQRGSITGSWQWYAQDMCALLQLDRGDLFDALEGHPDVVIDITHDRITLLRVHDLMG